MFKKSKIKKYNSGMTLIELLVVLAIFAIISGITMFDYSSFKSSASLNNLANDISLSIRKAQSYAIGAKGINSSFSDIYGVHFSTDNKSSFSVFANTSDNSIEELSITSGDYISGFIINNGNQQQTGVLDITFKRPNPDASFSYNGSYVSASNVDIILSSQKGDRSKIIQITNTGQISIQNDVQQN